VAEISRPMTGGHWCGSGSGYSVYFSEMSAVALTLLVGPFPNTGSSSLSKPTSLGGNRPIMPATIHKPLPGDSIVSANSPSSGVQTSPSMLDFDFKIRYKFVPKGIAVVR